MIRIKPLHLIILVAIAMPLYGCATSPRTPFFKSYSSVKKRTEIAILRTDRSRGLAITSCDKVELLSGIEQLLLTPGLHEIGFSVARKSQAGVYPTITKKYINVQAGHTYILVATSDGSSFNSELRYPDLVDVTDIPRLHIVDFPHREVYVLSPPAVTQPYPLQ